MKRYKILNNHFYLIQIFLVTNTLSLFNFVVGKVVSSSAEDECKPKANRPDLPPLPDYFNREKFLIFGDFEPVERRRLLRYITAYNG